MATTDKIPNIFLSYCWKGFKTYILWMSFLSLILFTGCRDRYKESQKWYDDTKAEILKQANLKTDSIVYVCAGDSIHQYELSYFKGHKFRKRSLKKEGLWLGVDVYYSINSDFELRREVCENDSILFEGIYYKGGFYGLSTWWKNCDNRRIASQVVRYKSSGIGIWKEWDKNGMMTTKDYKNIDKVDSMPSIFKQ